MSGPALMIGLPLLMAGVTLALGDRRWAAWLVATGTVGLLALAALRLPLGEPLNLLGLHPVIGRTLTVLGRNFSFELDQRPALMFMYLAGAFLFAGALPARPSRLYLPAGLASMGLLAAALFVEPFLFAAVFVALVAALTAVTLVDEEHRDTRGPLRYLAYLTLGMPFVLIGGWLPGTGAAPPEAEIQRQLMIWLGAGFAVWLAVVPFHSWVPTLADQAPPFSVAFVLVIVQGAILFFLLRFLNDFLWLWQSAAFLSALRAAGVGLAAWGGLLALAQRRLGRLMGYAVLVDLGAALAAISTGSGAGISAAMALVALRGLALGVWGLGLTVLRRAAGDDDLDRLRGLGRTLPLAAAATLASGLSLVGFPLTAGFPARWALLRLLAPDHFTPALVILLATIAVSLVHARFLRALLSLTPAGPPATLPGWLERAYLAGGVALILLLGLFPQWVLPAVTRSVLSLRNLAP